MANIYQLSYFANISIFHYPNSLRRDEDDRRIVLYDDHRTLLNVLYVSMHEGLFSDTVTNVVSFDRHDDAVLLSPKLNKKPNQ